MSEMLLTFLALLAVVFICLSLYIFARGRKGSSPDDTLNTMEKILERVKQVMVETDSEEYGAFLSGEEFAKAYTRKARFHKNLTDCAHGIEEAKIVITDMIRELIINEVPQNIIDRLLCWGDEYGEPPIHIRFETLLYSYKRKYGKQALAKLIDEFDLAQERGAEHINVSFNALDDTLDDSADEGFCYYISELDISSIYEQKKITLSPNERAELLAILIFQRYKGFGIIDTIREMDIDGINLGTSGALLPQVKNVLPPEFRAENSVWIYYQGKHIHLRFLHLESEDELRRIILGLIRYGSRGLTEKLGRVVATAPDKARVTALCPKASECWAVFVRKFGFSGKTTEQWVCKDYIKNGMLAVWVLSLLMRGNVTSMITGQQGTGKTTLLTSLIRYIDPRFTLRTLELAFEMYLRNIYPSRNILSLQETISITATMLQDVMKKTDGTVSIMGEVASHEVAANFIQFAQVASLFGLGTHHAKTAADLVQALRMSLTQAGKLNDYTAERLVTDVLKFDIHLGKTPSGERFIERITEIVQLPYGVPYPAYDGTEDSFRRVTVEYYKRVTDRTSFTTRDILLYDKKTHTYTAGEWFSESMEAHMLENLDDRMAAEFKEMKARWAA